MGSGLYEVFSLKKKKWQGKVRRAQEREFVSGSFFLWGHGYYLSFLLSPLNKLQFLFLLLKIIN